MIYADIVSVSLWAIMKKLTVVFSLLFLVSASSLASIDYLACYTKGGGVAWSRPGMDINKYALPPYQLVKSYRGSTWLKGVWVTLPESGSYQIFVMNYMFKSKDDAVGFCQAMRAQCQTDPGNNGQFYRSATGQGHYRIYTSVSANDEVRISNCDIMLPPVPP